MAAARGGTIRGDYDLRERCFANERWQARTQT